MSSPLGDWEAGAGVRFELAHLRLAEQDAERSEYLSQRCRLRSARGLPFGPLPRHSVRYDLGGWPVDAKPISTWTDPRLCAVCRRTLTAGPNGQGRPNKSGICKECHDSISGSRRQHIWALVAKRRAEITR